MNLSLDYAAFVERRAAGIKEGSFCRHCLMPLSNPDNPAPGYSRACDVCRIVGPAVMSDGRPMNPEYAAAEKQKRKRRRRKVDTAEENPLAGF